MQKLLSLIYKDYLLMIRDFAGLALMFVMPLCLVVIMAYLQDSTFNSVTETKIDIVVLNEDADSLGNAVSSQLRSAGIFKVCENGEGLTLASLEKSVADGEYQLGIFIPANTTAAIRESVHRSVLKAFGGNDSTMTEEPISKIRIFVDPTTKNSFKTTITSSVREFAARIQTRLVLNEVVSEAKKLSPMPIGEIEMKDEMVLITEQYAKTDGSRIVPNSVQHNVPAWAMFAVFFIVISLSGNMIKERAEGSYMRLLTMPCPCSLYLLSKVAVYLFICSLQFLAMIGMGIFVLPMLGLPSLEVGHSVLALIAVCLSASLAAIGYGIAIGKVSTSNQQAAVFGSISIVIMAAVGGIWIPTFVMPPLMQTFSHISPLNWGLSGFYDIFVRDCGLLDVLPECLALLFFALLCFVVAVAYDRKNIIK